MTSAATFAATFDARELAAAVKSIGKLIERRNSIPILSNVLIELGDDAATVTGTDLDIQATIIVPADVPHGARGARVALDAHALGAVLGKAERGALARLEQFGDGPKVAVTAGRARSNLATLPVRDFPSIGGDIYQDGPRFTLPAATLAHDLARLSPAMSTEETRYYLNGVQVTRDDVGRLDMVATDGTAAAFIVRGCAMPDDFPAVIIQRKTVATVVRMIGKKPAGDVTVSTDGKRIDVCGEGYWIAAKLVDGTFPDVRAAVAAALGDELQACAFPDAEPRLNGGQLQQLAKPCGAAFDVMIGDKAATFSYAAAPEYMGFTMLCREAMAPKGFTYERGADAHGQATAYLVELARSRGFDVARYFKPEKTDRPRYIALKDIDGRDRFGVENGDGLSCRGATFGGIARRVEGFSTEAPDFETLTMRTIYSPAVVEYEDGAFSIPMPRERRLTYAAVTIGEGDTERAIRTNARGEIELSAAQVQAMAGPVDTSAHVAIEPLPLYLGARLPDGWTLPLPAKGKAVAGYAVAVDAARLPFWTGGGVRDWAADRRLGLLVTDAGDWNWIDRGEPVAAAVADAEPVAVAVAIEPLGCPVSVADVMPPSSGAEVDGRADAPALPAQRRVCPVVPSPLSPFARAAVDDGPADDLAAMVAALLARVAALETANSAARIIPDIISEAGGGDAGRSRDDIASMTQRIRGRYGLRHDGTTQPLSVGDLAMVRATHAAAREEHATRFGQWLAGVHYDPDYPLDPVAVDDEAIEKARRYNADLEQRAAALPVYARELEDLRAAFAARGAMVDAAEADAREFHGRLNEAWEIAREAQRQLAEMTAERDALQAESDFLQAARGRTAQRLGKARATIALDRSALAAASDFARRIETRALAAEDKAAALPALHAEIARLRVLAPLAGIQWSGGHCGAVVAPKTPTRVPAPARLIVADGRRVAA